MFADLPQYAAFTHCGVRDGYEAVFLRERSAADGILLEGGTAASENGTAWSVLYRVEVDPAWRTSRVEASAVSPSGQHRLAADVRGGHWSVNGVERPDLDGCVDIDLESSLVTNSQAVHRIDLTSTTPVPVPAAFVHADDLRVERIEQTYLCIEHSENRIVFDYTSVTFGYTGRLVFDRSGLVLDYPGVGRRHL